MADAVIHTSFAAGELSQSLYARVDLDKYHVGAALLRNFFVDYRGGATTRPGTENIARVNPNPPAGGTGIVRLIDFTVSTLATYILEFGHEYVRFFTNGTQVLENAQSITAVSIANPGVFSAPAHGYSDGQEVFLNSLGGMSSLNDNNYLIFNSSTNTFELTDLDGNIISTAALNAYTGGGTVARVYTLTTPYADTDLAKLKYVQSADVMTLTHPAYFPADLARVTVNSFSYTLVSIGPIMQPPPVVNGQAQVGGGQNYGYVVTAVSADGTEESLISPPLVVTSIIQDQTQNRTIKLTWTPVAGQVVSVYNIYKWGPIPVLNPPASVFGYIGQSKSPSFTDSNIAADFSKCPPDFSNPFDDGQILDVEVVSGGAGYTGSYAPLLFTGDGSGALGYGIIDPVTHAIIACFLITNGKNYTNCTVTAGAGGATFNVKIGPQSGTFPACATYIQQRRTYGGPPNAPELMDMSVTGLYDNFNTTPTEEDNDAIQVSLAGRQVNAIVSMVPMSTGLVVFTTGGAYLITGGGPGSPITPTSITAASQASLGANDVPPIPVNANLLYIQSKGTTVRDLAFNFYLQSYFGSDRSTLASHLFYNHEILEWAYSYEPNKIVWCIREDGILLSLTYVAEQEVYAWARHDTNGLFQSVAAVSEGQTEATYFVVSRFINGAWVKFVERLRQEPFDNVWDAWCVDNALEYPLTSPAATLYVSANTGDNVVFKTDQSVFASGDIGKIIWCAGGQAQVVGFISGIEVTCNILNDMQALLADGVTVAPQVPGNWTLDFPVTTVGNLNYLEGQTVTGLADGLVIPPVVVNNGAISIPNPSTKIIVGQPFQCQLQTLYLDTGDPTIQGKMKFLPRVTIILNQSRGLKIGPTFDRLVECAYPPDAGEGIPPPLFQGDFRENLLSDWNVQGQICLQQDYPLPSSVLGLVPEVIVGDTAR